MASELVTYLRSLPDDWDSWLVHADELTHRDDERGQLLVLEHRGTDPERVAALADEWFATWGQFLGDDDSYTYKWIRRLAPLAGPPTPPDLLPVFAQPISQLLALLDPQLDAAQPRPDLSPVFELHRDRVHAAALAWVEHAFDGVPVPDENHRTIHQAEAADNYGSCDRSRDHLGRWQELPDAHLLDNQWALAHLDAYGIQYYVPAIMSFEIRRLATEDRGHWITESLGYTLTPGSAELRDYHQRRLARFDRAQRAAIYAFTLVTGDSVASEVWSRVFEAERDGERDDWFALLSPI